MFWFTSPTLLLLVVGIFIDPVAEKIVLPVLPVDGLNVNFVLDTLAGKLPVFAVTHNGYIVAFVVVSLVIPTFVEAPAVAAFKFATCVVEATTNGAVPVATVEVRTGADSPFTKDVTLVAGSKRDDTT